jgi:DNA-binding MarR family transcriptional regulator
MCFSLEDKLLAMKHNLESRPVTGKTVMDKTVTGKTVTDKNAIAFLTNPTQHRYLECFMGSESTMAQAAARLGEPLQRIFRKVRRMLELGLIEQTHLETRVGRSIRYYRTTSDQFFIPFSDRSFEEILLESNLNFERRFVTHVAAQWLKYASNNQGWGTTYVRGPHGRLITRAPVAQPQTPVPEPPNVLSSFTQWKLNPDDAAELFTDLTALLQRYDAKDGSGSQAFLVRVAMGPASDRT